MSEHTQEPWEVRINQEYPRYSIQGDGRYLGSMSTLSPFHSDEANADRIVVAVNATAGISTKALESGALQEALSLLEAIDESFKVYEAAGIQAKVYADALSPIHEDVYEQNDVTLGMAISDVLKRMKGEKK